MKVSVQLAVPVHRSRVDLAMVFNGEVLVCTHCRSCAWNTKQERSRSMQCPHCKQFLKFVPDSDTVMEMASGDLMNTASVHMWIAMQHDALPKRIANDNEAYTWREFLDYYEDDWFTMWRKAEPVDESGVGDETDSPSPDKDTVIMVPSDVSSEPKCESWIGPMLPVVSEPAALVSDAICKSEFFRIQQPLARNELFQHGGMHEDYSTWPFSRQYLTAPSSKGQMSWWRIPMHHNSKSLPAAERHSVYNGHYTNCPMVGFHRTSWEIITGLGRSVPDWSNNDQLVHYPSNIIAEGFMRNGINDSNCRGVWFYLGFQHPWPAGEDEIVVELEVVQSSIHKKSDTKWHLKFCAADSPPGVQNRWTRVRALHVPSNLLTEEFKEFIRQLR